MCPCIFEDKAVQWLEPLTLTRPAFDLRCGAGTLLERQLRVLGAEEASVLIRPELAALCEMAHPRLRIHDGSGLTVLVNARWLAPIEPLEDLARPRLGIVDNQVAYAVLPANHGEGFLIDTIDEQLDKWREQLPVCPAGGAMINYAWDLIEHNGPTMAQDAMRFQATVATTATPGDVKIVGPSERLLIADGATVEPYVLVDTRRGPVILDRGAVVQSFTRVEGPCYIGVVSWVVGGKISGTTLGPACRVGGEVQESILQGYSNKYHDGFLGHSWLGEWVNLGAGTQVSDLRNDYNPIKVTLCGERVATGRTKIGVFIGDHTKTGLSTVLNSGSVVGAFCNLLPSGTYQPNTVPSFCQARHGLLSEITDLRQVFHTAATVMRRRGFEMTDAHLDFFFDLYDQTASRRRKAVHEGEPRLSRQII